MTPDRAPERAPAPPDGVLTPALLVWSGAGWRPRARRRAAPAAIGSRWLDWPHRPWRAPATAGRAEPWLRPADRVLAGRRGRVFTSIATQITTSERTEVVRTITRRPWTPLAEVVRRRSGRRAPEPAAMATPVPGRPPAPPPALTVTVLRPVGTPGRPAPVTRLLRVEPGRAGARGPAGPAGPAGQAGTMPPPTVVRVAAPPPSAPPPPVAPAAPVVVPVATTGFLPAATAGPVLPDEQIEEVAARVLHSIERRAIAQRERMGRA